MNDETKFKSEMRKSLTRSEVMVEARTASSGKCWYPPLITSVLILDTLDSMPKS